MPLSVSISVSLSLFVSLSLSLSLYFSFFVRFCLGSPHFTAEQKAERAAAAAALAVPPSPVARGSKACFKKYTAKSKVGYMQVRVACIFFLILCSSV